ncbi:Hypothetical protein R9X50_00164800 [Acrodontium crateriforme]|uniref:Erythromycin esterase n=1 Tax=Acrodontium crateriforme TaxID=150365 RepID=A0AAQ3R2Y6_9PEZI|nr:Hypothetical protein R9X50_00164800 [Acrodontium crateriforme]
MARRSSARIRARDSATPQRVSLSHDALLHTPRTAPQQRLASLLESDEMPGSFPRSPSPVGRMSLAVPRHATTPTNVTPIKPSDEEMHPQLHYQSTAKPLDEARHLGFSNMAPQTEPPRKSVKIANFQGTPTRASATSAVLTSPKFEFTFRREQSLELSPDAKRLMSEMRKEAVRIREQMVASGEGPDNGSTDSIAGRKIAQPKAHKSRFSDVHQSQFQKMDSIAGHASAFRAQKSLTITTPSRQVEKRAPEAPKSLKRSPSKAELDQTEKSAARLLHRTPSKPNLFQPSRGLPRSSTMPNLNKRASESMSSPSKRVKRTEADDVSSNCQNLSHNEKLLPSTPQTNKSLRVMPRVSNFEKLTTPTRSSLARAESVKSTKLSQIPTCFLSASKSVSANTAPGTSPGLLSRSPSKAQIFSKPAAQKTNDADRPIQFMLQSPMKASIKKSSHLQTETPKAIEAPLLARSPMKSSIMKTDDNVSLSIQQQPATPLLLRSPSKLPLQIPEAQEDANGPTSPARSHNKSFMSRLNLPRTSPVKSILRSPQRLYSDDPSKVAAGTHLATPPKFITKLQEPATAPTRKRVDFSSSTKARFEEREASSIPSMDATCPSKITPSKTISSKPLPEPKTEPRRTMVSYPVLPSLGDVGSPSPQKRRETVGPLDFTFRAGSQSIIFSQLPKAPTKEGQPRPRATIRHVSSDFVPMSAPPPPVEGSKKRKFEFENLTSAAQAGAEEKENSEILADAEVQHITVEEDHRPIKRSKPNTTASSTKTADSSRISTKPAEQSKTFRRPTLGVKPKGVKTALKDPKESGPKRPTTISQSRLNALSQPKRRV